MSFTDESKVRQQQQDREDSCMEVSLAVAAKEQAEQSLQEIQAQLEESNASLERLRCELLRQQEQSEHGEAAAILGSFTALFFFSPLFFLLWLFFTLGVTHVDPGNQELQWNNLRVCYNLNSTFDSESQE